MITCASIRAMRRRAAANKRSWYWSRNSVDAALAKAAGDVERLCDEVERLRVKQLMREAGNAQET